jgi:hypothetical protein
VIPLSKNPPSRFPEGPINQGDNPWWVAKLKSRQEKAFAFDLLNREIEYYLPMYTNITKRKDNGKNRKSILPLFSGYLSFCTDEITAQSLFSTNRMASLIKIKAQKGFVKQLNQIYHTIDLKLPIAPLTLSNLSLGQEIVIDAGPMRGTKGHVVKNLTNNMVAISIEGLGMAAITIDSTLVNAI